MIYTGKETDAETEANVYLNVFGERGDTGKRLLVKSNNINKFKNGQVCNFIIKKIYLQI